MKRTLTLAPLVLLLLGCSTGVALPTVPSVTPAGSPVAEYASPAAGQRSPSPSPASQSPGPSQGITSPQPTPTPKPPSFAVLVDLTSSPSDYTLSIVDEVGGVARQLEARQRTPMNTHDGTGIQLPYVSASRTSLYYLDGDSRLLAINMNGVPPFAAALAVPSGSAGAFAVSPDDKQIAVSVLDYTVSPVHLTLYTDALAGGHKRVIYQSSSNYVWPVAWHSGLLVLAHAVGPFEEDIAKAAPARGNPYSAISYHLVDPTNAYRKVLMGACTVSGPLSPAGSGCIQGGAIDWNGNDPGPWSTTDWGTRSSAAALSPDGQWMAAAIPDNPAVMGIWAKNGVVANRIAGPGLHDWAGWITDQVIIIGSADPTWQPKVANVVSGGPVHGVSARGFFAAVLPTNIV